MYLKRLLQITIATIAAMGTVLLSMGQREVVLPLVMILAAGTSVWLTDITGILRLNRTLANVAMLLAALVSMRELMNIGGEIQAIGFARLLIYLQIIVLFQKKDARSYWLLIMLSLLQVLVAALFSQGVFFGLMLIIYMLITSLGLTLLLFQRQWDEFSPDEKPKPAAAPGRWPLAGQKPEFTGTRAGSIDVGLGRELYLPYHGHGHADHRGDTGVVYFSSPLRSSGLDRRDPAIQANRGFQRQSQPWRIRSDYRKSRRSDADSLLRQCLQHAV